MFRCLNGSALRLKCSWEESLPLTKAAGFDGADVDIDIGGTASRYSETLARHGLRPGGARLPFDFRDERAATKEGLAEIEQRAKTAADVGSTRFYVYVLSFSDTLSWKENFRFHVERITPIARVLAEHGCRIGLEFLGPKTLRDGHKHSFVHPMLDLCDQIGSNCGLLLDSWHWYTSLGTTEDVMALDPQRIV